jgi:hypothetical protein
MYHLSRSIYRELASDIVEEHDGESTNHERVLRSCETCVERLATDWHYFARPTKTLFNDIRIYFPMSAQLRVYKTVDRYMTFARDYFASNPVAERLECRATTRRGTPCQRVPLHTNGYCPSHQHLAETEEVEIMAVSQPIAA